MSAWFDLVSQLLSTSVCVFPTVSHMRESEEKKKKKEQLTPLFTLICLLWVLYVWWCIIECNVNFHTLVWMKHTLHHVHLYTDTLKHAHTYICGPLLGLIHSAGMSVWRQAVVCAPGMWNLTSGLEFEPPRSSSLFSEIRSHSWALDWPAEYLNSYVTASPQQLKGWFVLWHQLNKDRTTRKKQNEHQGSYISDFVLMFKM